MVLHIIVTNKAISSSLLYSSCNLIKMALPCTLKWDIGNALQFTQAVNFLCQSIYSCRENACCMYIGNGHLTTMGIHIDT